MLSDETYTMPEKYPLLYKVMLIRENLNTKETHTHSRWKGYAYPFPNKTKILQDLNALFDEMIYLDVIYLQD